MERGRLIVVEGVDGAGKSSLVRRLAERLQRDCGVEVVFSREPTDGVYGAKVRASASCLSLFVTDFLQQEISCAALQWSSAAPPYRQ